MGLVTVWIESEPVYLSLAALVEKAYLPTYVQSALISHVD